MKAGTTEVLTEGYKSKRATPVTRSGPILPTTKITCARSGGHGLFFLLEGQVLVVPVRVFDVLVHALGKPRHAVPLFGRLQRALQNPLPGFVGGLVLPLRPPVGSDGADLQVLLR